MNKKVSTLLTVALTLGGSLLSSSAFAEKVDSEQFTDALGKGLVLDVDALTKDGVIELTEDVNLEGRHLDQTIKRDLPFFIVDKPVKITSANGNTVTIKGNVVVAADGVEISGLNFKTPSTVDRFGGMGSWFSSLVSVFADNVIIKNNTFDGTANRNVGFREAIVIYPQNSDVEYSINENVFKGFTAIAENAQLNGAIKINLNTCNLGNSHNPESGKDTYAYKAIKSLNKKGIIDMKTETGEKTASPYIDIYALNDANDFEGGNSSNILVFEDNYGDQGNFISGVIFDELSKDSKTLKAVLGAKKDNVQIVVKDITVAQLQHIITTNKVEGNAVFTSLKDRVNVVVGEGKADYKFVNVKAEGAYDAITDKSAGKSYTLKLNGEYLQSDLTIDETPAYWNVSCPQEGVYAFTSTDGKKLTAGDGKYAQFEVVSGNTNNIFNLKVGKQYVGAGFVLVDEADDALDFGAHEVISSTPIFAEALNAVNEGSFSIDYRFDDDNVAEVNPFSGDVKAFDYAGKVFFATSWPESANSESWLNDSEFEKSVFIVATLDNKWNINNLKKDGEGAKFTEVQGKYLLPNPTTDDLKAGKYDRDNAAFTVTQNPVSKKFTLKLDGELSYLDKDNKLARVNDDLKIALIDDEAGLIVTTIGESYGENDDEIVVEGTITNSRTITVDKFLSTEKAKVFNIKFLSKNAVANDNWTNKEKETYSEYNKYLGIRGAEFFAQGSEFVNLEAPENQWIVSAADKDAKTITFQNRENDDVKFTASLVKTDKDGVYEVRTSNYYYLDYGFVTTDGKYVIASNGSQKAETTDLSNVIVELTEVTPNAQAGYATTELDNAGLVRFSFTANEYNNALVDDLFVTANDKNKVSVDKNEENATQFSVVKFDAASTSTALSDTIYADNDYVIWNASDKKVETVEDGDTIAVVSYAFKQLRADGKNFYLAEDMKTVVEKDDATKAPRFLVKINKNGSYSLINVDGRDYYRNIVDENAETFDLNTKSATAPITENASIYYEYENRGFDFNILKETPGTSYNHVPQHVTMEAVNGGYIAMNAENKEGIVAPVSTLKAEYTKEDLTFWLDTTDSEAVTPSFMISKAGNYMYNAVDSLNRYNDATASEEKVEDFGIEINGKEYAKAIFQSADLTKVEDIENYKFQIVQSADEADEYIIKSLNDYKYVAAHNQKLYFTDRAVDALKLVITPVEAPTSNEGVSATEVKVVAQDGAVVVKNAAGKNVVVSTILGQVVANEVLTSDNATINVPAGIVVVAVEGESFKVNVK